MTNRRQIPPPAQRPQSSREARGRGPLKAKAVSAKTRTRCAKSPTEYENLEELAPEYGVSEAEPPPTFNFSEVEWTGIESAVATVRKRRITKEESESLCYCADEFIANSNARITKSYPSPGKRRESWRQSYVRNSAKPSKWRLRIGMGTPGSMKQLDVFTIWAKSWINQICLSVSLMSMPIHLIGRFPLSTVSLGDSTHQWFFIKAFFGTGRIWADR
jgi:hypothetical protein